MPGKQRVRQYGHDKLPGQGSNNKAFLPYFIIGNRAFLPYFITTMKRRAALQIIRSAAKTKGRTVTIDKTAGKGSHYKVIAGTKKTTLPKEVSEPLMKVILKQLNLE